MAIKTIPDLTAVDALADEDLLVTHDSSADTTRRTTVGAVRSGRATTDALAAEVAARETHEAASNPHSGSASTADLATVGAAVTTHAARTDNPHAITAAQAGAIPATTGAATPYVSAATESAAGISELATLAEAVTGTDTSRTTTPATVRQAMLSLMRDNLGKFPGITPPSLNLFCGDATSDATPVGTFTRSTTGTRLGQTGLIETVAAGSVRREWDASGNLLGWLMEESRTNLLTYSEQLDNAIWLKSLCSMSVDAAVAPDGNTTADKLLESTDTGWHILYVSVSVTSGSSYAFSFFAKAGEISRFRADGSDAGVGAGNYADFNLSAGTATSYGNAVAQIRAIGNGWYRCSCVFQAIATTSVSFSIITIDDSGTLSHAGTGSSGFYLWGYQCEVGAFPTSYIPTTSAAVARSVDVWSITINTSAYKQSEGSILSVFDSIAGPVASANNTVLGLHNGTLSNRIFLRSNNSLSGIHCLMVYANETQVDIHLTPSTKNAMKKCAISYINNKTLFVENGGIIANDTLCTIPTITTINVGSGLSGADALNGHIKHIAYFPTALSDTQLQAITL